MPAAHLRQLPLSGIFQEGLVLEMSDEKNKYNIDPENAGADPSGKFDTPESRRRGRIDELIDSGFAAAAGGASRDETDGDIADLGDLATQLEAALGGAVPLSGEDSAEPEHASQADTDPCGSSGLDALMSDIEDTNGDTYGDAPIYADSDTAPEEDETVDEAAMIAPVDVDDSDFNTADGDPVGSTDMNLRIAFGLEEEETDSEGVRDAVRKLGDHLESNPRVGIKYQSDHPEFTDPIQAREIAAEYKSKRRHISIRLFFAVILTAALVIYENISTLTGLILGTPKQFAGPLDGTVYPVVYIMVSLQLLLLTALFALPELKRGVVRLFSGVPTPGSLTVLLLATGIVCSAVTAVTARVMTMPVTYNAVPAMAIVMTLVASRLNIKREMMTFFVAGSKKGKFALCRVPDDEAYREIESEEELYGDVMRVERTDFVGGFFARSASPDRMTNTFIAAMMGLAAAAAILFGIFTGRAGGGVSGVVNIVYLAIIALSPLSVYLTFSYPFYRAASAASEADCAIIGENSLEEYSATAVVSFDDVNVFPSYGVKVQNIRIYNNARIDRVLYYASSVFRRAGGPLSDVFEIATMEMGRSEDVEILDADSGYLDARTDGVRITFGSLAALSSRGYDIPDEVAMDDVDFSDEMSIMYMFREDVLVAKMYIKYVLDGDIEPMLSQFREYGMLVCVRTFDPNIDEDMIAAKLSMKKAPIKVVRYRSADEVGGKSESTDSGLVTFGSPKSLLQLLPYCDKTIHTKRTCAALSIMSVIIGLMLLVVFSMSSGLGMLNSLYIIAYNLAWMIPAYLASKIFIR